MSDDLSPAERAKKAAAARAISFVEPGMKLGLGTGSTAAWLVKLLGEQGYDGECVPTSSRPAALAADPGNLVKNNCPAPDRRADKQQHNRLDHRICHHEQTENRHVNRLCRAGC